MSLQNRVTPFGDIVATPQRGLFTGNRGIIHDPATRTLLTRRWSSRSWLICSCEYKGRRRNVMAERSWTELFFLDEATALAAGHRPCFLCRRDDAEIFRAAWAEGNEEPPPSAVRMDEVLHRERLQDRRKRLHVPIYSLQDLPDGAIIAAENKAYLIAEARPFEWSFDGYQPAGHLPFIDGVLTPPSSLAAMRAGYRPALHPSLETIRTNGHTP